MQQSSLSAADRFLTRCVQLSSREVIPVVRDEKPGLFSFERKDFEGSLASQPSDPSSKYRMAHHVTFTTAFTGITMGSIPLVHAIYSPLLSKSPPPLVPLRAMVCLGAGGSGGGVE